METSNGLYINKTKNYLIPVLKQYGDNFIFKINELFKYGFGISDKILPMNLEFKNHIFMLVATDKISIGEKGTNTFSDFLNWIREKEYYEYDYVFDNVRTGNKHMIVMKVPEQFTSTYNAFVSGKYSEMFPGESRKLFFKEDDDRYKVFCKHPEAIEKFKTLLKKDFDAEFESWEEECEYPMVEKEEIFNY